MKKILRALALFAMVLFMTPTIATYSLAQNKETKTDETFLLLMAARNAAKAHKYETSIKRYHQLLEKKPQSQEARMELGWVYLKSEKLQDARREFQTVLNTEPRNMGALKGLLESLKKSGEKAEALKILEQLVARIPDDRDLRMQLALELHNQGKYAEAEKHLGILLKEEEKGT